MAYIDGFVIPVKTADKQVFIAHAQRIDQFFIEFGGLRVVEAWGDDVPAGKITDFARSVQATAEETVVFSWVEWPDKATRDAAMKQFESNAELMAEPMPFDGKRMIFGGFDTMVDANAKQGRDAAKAGYIDGFVTPVPTANQAAYRALADKAAAKFLAQGAIRSCENWGADVPAGKVTDFMRSVMAQSDEVVVFSWVEWPDKATRNAGWEKIMADPEMQPAVMPFDGKRMVWGSFEPVYWVARGANA